jgi:hypothetical protein
MYGLRAAGAWQDALGLNAADITSLRDRGAAS